MKTRTTLLMVAAALAAGCGPNVAVTGQITRAGAPVGGLKGMHLNVTLHPIAPPSAPGGKAAAPGPDLYAANVSEDGSFVVPGVDGDGIPPGKYRVAVVLRDDKTRAKARAKAALAKSKYAAYDPDHDYLNDAFGPDNSPIIREIPAPGPLVIDLNAPGA